jgi:hypothetical protein
MEHNQHKLLGFWPLFFLLAFLEAAVALIVLVRIPNEGGGLILGFSITRWAIMLPLLEMSLLTLAVTFLSWKSIDFRNHWLGPDARPKLYKFLSLAFPVLAVVTGIGAFILRWWDPERLLLFFERAWPLLAFIIVFSIQSTLWLFILRFGIHKADFPALKPALIAFALLLLVFGFVSLTKFGLTPDPAYWGEPGVPIQGWQLGLALIISASLLPISLLPIFKSNSRRTDFIIGFLIWALAAGIWLSVPNEVLRNSFYFPIDPPANVPMPYSDSGYYDYMAHSLLIGTDYTGEIPTRPLYILFLTGLHLLFGENYNLIIAGQTTVLALFPVFFYALGNKLHSRTAGVTIALLAIFRDWTSMLVASDTRVSNSKILLVDTPTLLLILLACLLTFRWLEQNDKRSAFIAGGVFGILLLLRTQSMLILPFLFVVAIFVLRANRSPWLAPLLIFILGVVVSIAPWLTHNYLRIGKFAFDAPFQYQVLVSQYAYTGNLDFTSVDLEGKSLSQLLITFALKDPGFVAGFIVNHFLATEIGALLALPLINTFNGLRAPINLYWISFDGTLAWYNIFLVMGYLVIIAIGLGAAWRRWRWTGLLPLAFNLGYALANGIGRFSGWRYDLPADWIAYLYFGIGFAEILFWLAKTFGSDITPTKDKIPAIYKGKIASSFLHLIAIFGTIGAFPWIAESVNPPSRYPNLDPAIYQAQIIELASTHEASIDAEAMQSFAAQENAVTQTGRLLYPRYFGRGGGISSTTPWPSYAPRDFPRVGFLLINERVYEVVFPSKGISVPNVHGEDVLLLGCQQSGYIEARLLAFPNADLVYLSDRALKPCSP